MLNNSMLFIMLSVLLLIPSTFHNFPGLRLFKMHQHLHVGEYHLLQAPPDLAGAAAHVVAADTLAGVLETEDLTGEKGAEAAN